MSDKKNGGPIDPEAVRELAAILKDLDLTEIELEHGELKLRLSRAAPVYVEAPAPRHAYAPAPAAHAAPPPPSAPATPKDLKDDPRAVPSPMVGTVYLAAEPGGTAFVKVGDTVSEGQTVLIVEAMKTFNPIPAPRAGVIRDILVTDAQPVEFGEILMLIE